MKRARLRSRAHLFDVRIMLPALGGLFAFMLLAGMLPGSLRAQSVSQEGAVAEAAIAPDSVAAEIRSQVGGQLKKFYAPRGFWPLWIHDGTIGPEADRLIGLLSTADLDGLDPKKYEPEALREMVAQARGGSPAALAKAELKLSSVFADYVRDVRRAPTVKITYLDRELVPERLRKPDVLRVAALAPSFADYINGGGWMSPFYARLRDAMAEYNTRWHNLPRVAVPPGPLLRAGAKGERVRLLRQRLGLADGSAFDKATVAALRAFQADHGLPADALAGTDTIAALNRDSGYYERLIRLNLERARILPSPRTRHIVVDAASARLWAYDAGKEQDTMRVIVGKPTEQTPMLAGMVRYATLNPYWNVPTDLVQHRLAQRVLGGASLQALNFQVLSDWSAGAQLVDPGQIDWNAVASGQTVIRVRQLPGSDNAMGRVKFMFPNDLGIYLHDTPDKDLFAKPERRFSSGCVRLEDAPRLGQWLFGKPLEPSSDAPEQHVPLPQGVPVYLTYLTVAPTDKGIAFLDDAYGRDGAGEAGQTAAR